jgi:hypothetical protein
MRSLITALPSVQDLLALSPRKLGGYILQLMNADGSRRDHPKNIRNHVTDVYAGPSEEKAAANVLAALDLLKSEHYIFNDYQDTVDPNWFALTEKGLSIRDASQVEEPARRLDSDRSVVFISCGQYADNEKVVGRRIAELVEEFTDCGGYFAENQQSLDGLSNNILHALNQAAGIVVVMHKRGLVETPSGERFYRGSIWLEQETAIAAFLQSLDRSIPVAAYIEDGIKREGLRELLQLNPISFQDDQQILSDFEQKLRSGNFSPNAAARAISGASVVQPILGVEATIIGPDESRQRQIYPESNSYRLLLHINNAGAGPARNITVNLNGFPGQRSETIEPVASGGEVFKPFGLAGYVLGNPGDATTPELIDVTYNGEGSSNGRVLLRRIPESHPPRWSVVERRDPTSSTTEVPLSGT